MAKPLVSIILVNWNGRDVLGNCLESLTKLSYPNLEIVLVDNGSTDNSYKLLSKFKFPKKLLIRNRKNLGFAQGNNIGYKKSSGEFVLLLNNDTVVVPDFLDKLVAQISKYKTIGVVQPKIRIMDDPSLLDSIGSYLTRTGFLQHFGYLQKDNTKFDKPRFVFSAKGACMLIRRSIIEKVGLFDPDYGSYLEDTDFCWRVWLLGYKILYWPDAEILHKVGFSSKRQNQVFVNYHSFKNRIATLYKNLSLTNLVTIGGLHLLILLMLCMYYLLTLRIENSKLVISAINYNFKNWQKLVIKRNVVQRFRTKSDKQLFNYILKPVDVIGMFGHFLRSEKMFKGKHEV